LRLSHALFNLLLQFQQSGKRLVREYVAILGFIDDVQMIITAEVMVEPVERNNERIILVEPAFDGSVELHLTHSCDQEHRRGNEQNPDQTLASQHLVRNLRE